jgi:DNA-directed RNA polymerase specialized sigma24 family protein
MTATALSAPPAAPKAPALTPRELLARVWPYLAAAANRRARRYGLEPDDVLHDMAVRVLRTAHRFRPADGHTPATFAYWVCKYTFRARFLRRWLRLWAEGVGPDEWDRTGTARSREPDPAVAAELADGVAAVTRYMPTLAPRRRQAVTLRFGLVDGNPVVSAALAQALGVYPTTADALVRRGLRQLARLSGADPARSAVDRAEGITLGKLNGRTPKKRRTARKWRRKKPVGVEPA